MDNWYTSQRLILSLYDNKVGVCGTVRSNRKYFPAELAVKASRVDRGFYDYRTSPPLLACVWKDERIINFLSNMHKAETPATVLSTVVSTKAEVTREVVGPSGLYARNR